MLKYSLMRDDIRTGFKEIVDSLLSGDLVVMKSDTIYGIFGLASSEITVAKLHEIRERNPAQGFIVLCDSVEMVASMVDLRDEISKRLKQIWRPQNFATSVILAAGNIREKWLVDQRAEFKNTICFRVPNDEILRELLRETGPLVAPSANPHGKVPARNIREAENYFGDQVSLYVDGGEVRENTPSRIIKFAMDGSVETVRADGHVHPEDFVISRRRKQFRFNKFDEFANCFQLREWVKARDDLLGGGGSLVVEIAVGSALFSVEIARRNPDKIFVAVDIKSDRLYRGARRANELKLANIFFVRGDIAKIAEVIPPGRAGEIWLTFPDPQLPERDAKHRLTSARFLKLYQEILRPDGAINFKTDSKTLFEWSLNSFREAGFAIEFQSRDLHSEKNSRNREIPNEILREARVMTTYEEKFTREGRPISFARFSRI